MSEQYERLVTSNVSLQMTLDITSSFNTAGWSFRAENMCSRAVNKKETYTRIPVRGGVEDGENDPTCGAPIATTTAAVFARNRDGLALKCTFGLWNRVKQSTCDGQYVS